MPVSKSAIARDAVTEKLKPVERMMRAYFVVLRTLGRSRAATPEELYGFRAFDVSEIHRYKAGVGRGVWYRLKDGRVFDREGKPSRRDRAWYSMRPPKPIRTTITLDPPVAKIGAFRRRAGRKPPPQPSAKVSKR
jgi:hypothetical protein